MAMPGFFGISHIGGLAQMVERSLCMREARGSIPLTSTNALKKKDPSIEFIFACQQCKEFDFWISSGVGMVQWLARLVYTEKVAGSNPAVDNYAQSFQIGKY